MNNVCNEHSGCLTEIDNLKKGQQDLWDAVNDIRKALNYRLPLWATFLISGLFSVIGYLTAMLRFAK